MSEAPAPVVPRKGAVRDAAAAFFLGVALALIQMSFFFMLEVHVTSRADSYFVAVLFWLIGFLFGLNRPGPRVFGTLLFLAPLAYYTALGAVAIWPYRLALLPIVGACIAVGGAMAGSFFPWAEGRFPEARLLFFHENNGFVAGLGFTLLASVFFGRSLLRYGPLVGVLPVVLLLGRSLAAPAAGDARATAPPPD